MKEPRSVRGKPTPTRLSRRSFLGTAAAFMAPALVRGRALGRDGAVPASERIIIGGIGLRGRGMGDLRWLLPEPDIQFVAICDAQKRSRDICKEVVDKRYGNTDCKTYPEAREYLAERTDIDAILMATGDRWHALMSIYAMRAGKDVYTEKPSCMTIAEGQAVVDTCKRYGRVYQTGTQRVSEANHVFAIEAARTGLLGKVHTAYAHIAAGKAKMRHDWLPAEKLPPKDVVDWDAWLGPCPWRPYSSAYVARHWRGHHDFHTSCIGEWGAHTFMQAQAGLDKLDTSPVHYQYVDNNTGDGMVTTFEDGTKLILSQGSKHWRGPSGERAPCGERLVGDEGWAGAADRYSKPDVSNPAFLGEFRRLVGGYMARTQRPMNHMRNWLDCIKSRRQTAANAEAMYRSMSTVHAANICMWLERDLRFDPKKGKFIDDEANTYVSRAMREPWII